MTLQEYLSLDETGQMKAVWDWGVLIDTRIVHPYKFELYQLDNFYTELRFRSKELLTISAFDVDSGMLIPYLEKLQIPDLRI